ncbi:MAG: glycoside hydrolase family 127 protein [Planctomycetota bacterium]
MKKQFRVLLFVALVVVISALQIDFAEGSGIEPVPFTNVKKVEGFWAPRLETNRKVTVPYAFSKCEDTGRISNFAKAGGLMTGDFEGIYFNDSDVYKVIEGAAYSLQLHPDPELEMYVDVVIDKIAAAQWEDGYLYTHYSVPKRQPEKRWTNLRDMHELYCAGHFFEAAVAYYQATGKRTILDVAIRLADKIDSVFGPAKRYDVPGHEEIEIGLVRLYRVTGDDKYLKLAKFFLEQRGRTEHRKEIYGTYCQDHIPVTEQSKAIGHSVRAGYLYSGMADVAALTGDTDYIAAIDRIWEDVVKAKLYLTGGIGARHGGEAFGEKYELPNKTAYNETCAAIANAMWNHRLFLLHGDSKYIDVLERIIYNGFLSGISMRGNAFFYPNPLASNGGYQRSPWFGCACCPVNVVRFVPSIPGYIYARNEDIIYVNLFIAGQADIKLDGGKVKLTQQTRYPWDGKVKIIVEPEKTMDFAIAVRIPGWAKAKPVPSDLYRYMNPDPAPYSVTVTTEGPAAIQKKGYVIYRRRWKSGDEIKLDFPMQIRRVLAHPEVQEDVGKVALERGPIVYCLEGLDNGGELEHLMLPDDAPLKADYRPHLLNGVCVIHGRASALRRNQAASVHETQQEFLAIPYYAWAHRGPGKMAVWIARQRSAVRPLPAPTIASKSKVAASHTSDHDTTAAMNDQLEPKNSIDHEIPRFTWWDHKGGTEWVQYDFEKMTKVSSVEVYWFDDSGRGECRVPESWRLLYKHKGQFKPVNNAGMFGVEKDRFNKITFDTVKADALRIEVKLQKNFSGGILEWKVK